MTKTIRLILIAFTLSSALAGAMIPIKSQTIGHGYELPSGPPPDGCGWWFCSNFAR